MIKSLKLGVAAIGALGGIGSCEFLPIPLTSFLKYGHAGPVGPDSDDHVAGEFLKFFLESRSNGAIEVQIFPGSQLGSFREMVEQVNAGTLELAHVALGGLVGFHAGIAGDRTALCHPR